MPTGEQHPKCLPQLEAQPFCATPRVLQHVLGSSALDYTHVCFNATSNLQGKRICYYFSKTQCDWNSSREQCQRLGASLATVDTEEELSLLAGHLLQALPQPRCPSPAPLQPLRVLSVLRCPKANPALEEFVQRYQGPKDHWIGLHRAEGDKHWTWADGRTFTNWSVPGTGPCVYLSSMGISSTFCHDDKFWVCSRADSFVLWRNGTNPH
ncbi:C-type lectin domain family 2 member D-like isoform X1 [Meleagris gallopavo]|uniref:C-type lectin domain family 2 member D-like isoform X1 n=1 Tax=Meleagris gallopavo TaxID=9103 RepID=UPI0012AC20B6|nr:C-type lectin domain family 2 member D-like isoform X1 [Meleagris gallopavo]XP_031413599.1 C-type lectin domain family 2 member D-like isoform X1 [Meleagris gallopavo]